MLNQKTQTTINNQLDELNVKLTMINSDSPFMARKRVVYVAKAQELVQSIYDELSDALFAKKYNFDHFATLFICEEDNISYLNGVRSSLEEFIDESNSIFESMMNEKEEEMEDDDVELVEELSDIIDSINQALNSLKAYNGQYKYVAHLISELAEDINEDIIDDLDLHGTNQVDFFVLNEEAKFDNQSAEYMAKKIELAAKDIINTVTINTRVGKKYLRQTLSIDM